MHIIIINIQYYNIIILGQPAILMESKSTANYSDNYAVILYTLYRVLFDMCIQNPIKHVQLFMYFIIPKIWTWLMLMVTKIHLILMDHKLDISKICQSTTQYTSEKHFILSIMTK